MQELERLRCFVERISKWLEQTADKAERQARAVQNEFPAFARACWDDAKNLRVMLRDARRAMSKDEWGSITQEQLDMPVDVLEGYGVSLRVVNLLSSSGCQTVGQLVSMKMEQLSSIRQIGPSSAHAVQQAVRMFLEGQPATQG